MIGSPAVAFDWGGQVTSGYTWTDNIAQAPDGDSANILNAGLSAAIEHSTRTLSMDAEANHLYRYFPGNDDSSDSRPSLRGNIDWIPLAERLRFSVSDIYGQVALNPSEGLLPSDYENANVATAGSQWGLPLSQDIRLQAAGEYRYATFDVTPVDTRRTLGELRAEYNMSRLISLFASGSRSRTQFDVEGISSAYDIDSVLLGFDAVARRSALSFAFGVDSLKDDEETFSGSRYDLQYERQISRDAMVFVSGTREIADAADVFSLAQISDPALVSIRDVQVTPQPLVRQAYLLGYALSGNRLSFSIAGGYRKEHFRPLPESEAVLAGTDRNIRELLLNGEYVWSQRTSMLARAEFLRERFVSGVTSNDLIIGLSWLRRIAPRIGIEAGVQRIERSNSPRNFDELRFELLLRYTGRELPGQGEDVFDRAFERRARRARESVGLPVENVPPATPVPADSP